MESNECQGKADGIYPNPSNCSTFFACSGNRTYVMHCNDGLLFDQTSKRCEWASAAKCAPGIEQVPEAETTMAQDIDGTTTAAPLPGLCDIFLRHNK